MSEETDVAVMKKCLEDAGIFEENMSSDMVKQVYEAIKESEVAADKESHSRRLDHSDEDLLKQLDESINEPSSSQTDEDIFVKNTFVDIKSSSSLCETEDPFIDSDTEDKMVECNPQNIKDVSQFPLSYSDMCTDTSGNILPIVCHKLEYVAIQNSQNFLQADSKKRVEMMRVYFEEQARFLTKLAKVSKHVAPLPKPIIATHILTSVDSQDDVEETYVSRSGRQTKRKVYNYDDDSSQEEAATKKTKNEDTNWLSKSSLKSNPKTYSKKKSDTSIASELFDKEKAVLGNAENKENGKVNNNTSTEETKSLPKRTFLNKKLSNMEIMQRSPLFSDTPNKKSRSEEILERARAKEVQKKKEEKITNDFVQKLEVNSEDQGEDVTMEIIDMDDEVVPLRRRIVPPIPGRKGVKKTKAGMEPLPITSSPTRKSTKSNTKEHTSENSKQEPKPSGSEKTSNKAVENGLKSEKSNISETSKGNRVLCPLCSLSFRENEIEAHASTCCDDDTVRIRRSSAKLSRITCDVCDKVVPLDNDYEVHVKECIGKHRE